MICWLCLLFCSCGVFEDDSSTTQIPETDTISPVIFLDKPVDTAYLFTSYYPRDVHVLDKKNGKLQCCNSTLKVSGDINLNIAGTYFLYYDVIDESGNAAATVTRTLHVVENKSAFLNGPYNVVCTCTTVCKEPPDQTINSTTYQAEISSEPVDHFFKLISVNVGKDHVAISSRLQDSVFDVSFFSPDYHFRSSGSGTMSASKNSFTIGTTVYHYSGNVYKCINIYRRKLMEIQ